MSDKICTSHDAIHTLEGKVRRTLFDLDALSRARDAVIHQMFKAEDVSSSADKKLMDVTTEDSETWTCIYSKGADLITEKQMELCVKVSNIKVDIDVLRTKIDTLRTEQNALGDKLSKEFHAKQLAPSS